MDEADPLEEEYAASTKLFLQRIREEPSHPEWTRRDLRHAVSAMVGRDVPAERFRTILNRFSQEKGLRGFGDSSDAGFIALTEQGKTNAQNYVKDEAQRNRENMNHMVQLNSLLTQIKALESSRRQTDLLFKRTWIAFALLAVTVLGLAWKIFSE